MSEQLALQQVLVQRRAVDHHERLAAAPALPVYRARHELLARAAFAADQHRGVRVGHPRHHVEQLADLRRAADEALGRLQPLHLALERRVAALQVLALECLLEHRLQLGQLARLGEEVERAELHGADRLLDRSVGGEHQHFDLRRALLDLAQQVEAAAVGEPHVQQHQVERLLHEQAASLVQRTRPGDAVTGALKLLADQLPEGFLVVDEQQRDLSHPGLRLRGGAAQR